MSTQGNAWVQRVDFIINQNQSIGGLDKILSL